MVVNAKIEEMALKTVAVSDQALRCCSPLGEGALSEEEAVDLAGLFGVLSDPARLRMLSLIASADETCSCALEDPLERSQPTISHHTRVLADAGLIEGERRGRWTWWRVVPGRLEAIARILAV
jgi:ArsR family transcriptional regulator